MSRVADWRSLWPMCADTVMWQRAGGAAARRPRRAARATRHQTEVDATWKGDGTALISGARATTSFRELTFFILLITRSTSHLSTLYLSKKAGSKDSRQAAAVRGATAAGEQRW